MADGSFSRHDLVRIDPAVWAEILASRPELDGLPHLSDWAEAGWPLIVRRYGPDEARDHIPLGLPLPPANGKRRIAFACSMQALRATTSPTLREALPAAPPDWQPTLETLIALADQLGLAPRPFGSLLWQALTGLEYLTPFSDCDLLWPVAAPLPGALLDGLATIAASTSIVIDGEVLLPDGAGIHWRELHEAAASGEVLAKHRDRLALLPASALRERAAA